MFDDEKEVVTQQSQTQTQPPTSSTPQKSSLFRDDFSEDEVDGKTYDEFIKIYAKRRGVPSKVVRQLIRFESSDNNEAVSEAGAEGSAQMMPKTSSRLGVNPFNKWEAAIGAIHYLEDEYKALRPKTKNDMHGWHAAAAAYLAGRGKVAAALDAGKYLPDGDDDKDKYTGLPIPAYVERIFAAAGGANYLDDDETPQSEVKTQPAPPQAQGMTSPELSANDVSDPTLTSVGTDETAALNIVSKGKESLPSLPAGHAQARQGVIDTFGEGSKELAEYDKAMSQPNYVSPGSKKLLEDTEKGLVKTREDYAKEEQSRQQAAIKQNQAQLDSAEQEAYAQYKLTGNRTDYDNALKNRLVGSFTVQVAPGVDGGIQYQIEGKPVDAATASEYAVRQLAGQFTRDAAAIERVVQDYKLRGGGQVRLFDAESGKPLDDSRELKNYEIRLPADVALSLRRSNKQLEQKQSEEANRKLEDAKGMLFSQGWLKGITFNGVANQALGKLIGLGDEKLGEGISTYGFNSDTGQFYDVTPEFFGFEPGTKEYERAADTIFGYNLLGTVLAEYAKLVTAAPVLSRVGNVVGKGTVKGFEKVLPAVVRLSQSGEVTAASGSIVGTEAFTSAAQLSESALQASNLVSRLVGSTTAFAGLQTIAPQGWAIKTDAYGKMLGLERAAMDMRSGKLRPETVSDVAQNFGKHWLALAAFSAIDMGVTSRVAARINNPAVQKYMRGVLEAAGYSPDAAYRAVTQTLTPGAIKALGTAASSFAYTAINNQKAALGLLSGDRRSLIDFGGDYLMNVTTMHAMKRAHSEMLVRDPRTGKVYAFGKDNGVVSIRELKGSEIGVEVVEPTTKLELDFLTKTFVDNHGSAAQKARINADFFKSYVEPEVKAASETPKREAPVVGDTEHDPDALRQMQGNRGDDYYGEVLDEQYAALEQGQHSPIDFEVKEFPKTSDFPAQENARKQENLSEKVVPFSDSLPDDYSFLADTKKPGTSMPAEDTPAEIRQTADVPSPKPADNLQPRQQKQETVRTAPTDGAAVTRRYNNTTYQMTPEQARLFDEAARERDEAIRAADEAPPKARLEERVSPSGARYRRWVDSETGEEIPRGTPPPNETQRSLARRQAEFRFTQRVNEILGRKSDEPLRTNTSTETTAAANAANGTRKPGTDFSGRTEPESDANRAIDTAADGDGAGRSTAPGDVTDAGQRSDVSSTAPEASGKRRVTLNGKAFETTGRQLEEDGVQKVEVRDARGRRFYVDADLVGDEKALFRREELPVHEGLRKEAEEYAASKGLKYSSGEYFNPDEKTLRELGELMEDLPHEPDNPEVQKTYKALKQETVEQWDFLRSKGVVFEPWTKEGQPYANSKEMRQDVIDNKHLYFYTGGDMDASHPLKEETGINVNGVNLTYNDVFRAVHDYFGHAVNGSQFGARGEFNATDSHARMYSPDAARAMVGETVFQNSYVNYGRHLRRSDGTLPKKGDADFVPPANRPYAPQKALNITPEMMEKWKSAYGERREAAPLPRVQSLLDSENTSVGTLRKLRDNYRQAMTRFRMSVESYDAYVSGKGFVQSGDNHIFYDSARSREISDASHIAFEAGEVGNVISYTNAAAVTIPAKYANKIGKYVDGALGSILRSATKSVALLNYESAERAINYAHETVHTLVAPLQLSDAKLAKLKDSPTFKALSEELKGGSYSGAEVYEMAQEALAFSVTGDAKRFGRNVSEATLKKAAKEVFEALREENPDVPIGQLKKLALGIGRDVVKDIAAAERTARALGEPVDRDFLLRRAEQLKDVPQEVFDDAASLPRQEFIEKYRGAYSYAVRKAVLDTLPERPETIDPRAADDRRVWSLEHYSREARTELLPEYAGTANAGKEKVRLDRQPVTYFYLAGTKPETMFSGYVKHRASEELNIYDLSADKLSLRDKFSGDASAIEAYLKKNGFDGYWSPETDADATYRNIVAVFKPTKVEALFRKDKIDTEEFKRWFGDSKVVDRKGNPLVVYHGTRGNFDVFHTQPTDKEPGSHFGTSKAAEVFTKNYKGGYWDSSNIVPAYLNIRNPVEVSDVFGVVPKKLSNELVSRGVLTEGEAETALGSYYPLSKEEMKSAYEGIVSTLKAKGYDGFKYTNLAEDSGSTSWVVFDPTQIKSVFNKGSFDPENPSTLFRRESDKTVMSEEEAKSLVRNGDYVMISGNQSDKQTRKDVARTASLKKELERKGFEVYEAQGNYLDTKENSLMVMVRNKDERDLLSAIAGAYKQKQIFIAQSGKYTAPFTNGIQRENYSKTNEMMFDAEALKQDGYTKVVVGNQEVVFSIADLYNKDRAAKYSATRNEIADAYANQQKFFHKKALSWHLLDAINKGIVKGGDLAGSLENLEAYYQKVHPLQTGTQSEKMARYVDDITKSLRHILDSGLYNQEWYSDDLKRMFDNMKETFPHIDENKAAQQVFGLMLAVSSRRMNVTGNFNAAAEIFTEFLKELQVPTHQPGKLNKEGEPLAYGIFTDALVSANKLLSGNIVVPTKKGLEWKESPEFKKDIAQRGMQAIFDYLAKPSFGSQKERDFISQEIFGMKIGSFLLNLNGEAYIPTIDSWMMRTWNVINGGTVLKKKDGSYNLKEGKKQTSDSPSDALGDALRGAYQSAARRLTDEGYSITPVEAQALVWMHYKAMLNKLQGTGANEKSTYSESSEYVLGKDSEGEIGGTLGKFSKKFGTEGGKVARDLGKDIYLQKPNVRNRAFFRAEGDEASQHEDLRDKLFYSQLSRTIQTRLPEKFSKQMLKGFVENTQYGIKKDELIWSGFDELLAKGGDVLTKEEVLNHIQNNRVKIYERQSKLNNPNSTIADPVSTWYTGDFNPQYRDYTTDAGKDYREILIKAAGVDAFRKHYFGEENIIATARIKTLEQNGERVLMVEEIQSDHHQEGRKRGYKEPPNEEILNNHNGLRLQARKAMKEMDDLGFDTTNQALEEIYRDFVAGKDWKKAFDVENEPGAAVIDEYLESKKEIRKMRKGVNDAPFKKNWHEVTFRRLLKYAADNGYDRIAWTSGNVQAERYSLDKHFEEIRYNSVFERLEYIEKGQQGIREPRETVSKENLPDYVGEEIAQRLINGTPNESGSVVLKGDDLRYAGGDGMRGFYDKMLVDYAKKLGKKVGSTVEPYKLNTNEKIGETLTRLINRETGEVKDFDSADEAYLQFLLSHDWEYEKQYKQADYHSMPVTPKFSEPTPLFRRNVMQSEGDWLDLAARAKNQPLNEKEINLIREAYQTGATEAELYEIADRMHVSVPRFLIKLYKANLLSGIGTSIANTTSNALMQATEEVKRLPASFADYLNSKATGQPRTVQGISPRGIAYAMPGLKIGFKEFIKDVIEEDLDSPYAYYNKSGIKALDNTIGKLADLTIRFVGGQDKIFSGYAVRRAAYEQAALRAKNEGISIQEALDNPTLEASDYALRYGLYTTFREDNALTDAYTGLKRAAYEHAAPLGWLLDLKVPFVRTGTNIMNVSLDYLGVNGTLKGISNTYKEVDAKSWQQTKENFQKAWSDAETRREAFNLFGRGAVGLGLAYLFYQAAQAGLVKINSYYDDDDYEEMNRRANDNSNPMSIKVGGRWYGFGRLSPVGTFAAAGAALYEMSKGTSDEAKLTAGEFGKQFLATAPLGKAVSDVTKPRIDKDKPWYAYLLPEAQTVVPMSGLLREVAATGDVKRQTKVKGDYGQTQINKVKEIIPGMRSELPVKTSNLGYTQDTPNNFLGFSTVARETPLTRELERLSWEPSPFDPQTKKEYTQRQKVERRQVLEKVVASDEYRKLKTNEEKKYALETALRSLVSKEERRQIANSPEKQKERTTRRAVRSVVKGILNRDVEDDE